MSTIEIRKIGITKLDTDGNHDEPKLFIAHINSRCFWQKKTGCILSDFR